MGGGAMGMKGTPADYTGVAKEATGALSDLSGIAYGLSDRIRQRRRDKKFDPLNIENIRAQNYSLSLANQRAQEDLDWRTKLRKLMMRGTY